MWHFVDPPPPLQVSRIFCMTPEALFSQPFVVRATLGLLKDNLTAPLVAFLPMNWRQL